MNHIMDLNSGFINIIEVIEDLKKEISRKYTIDYYGQDARMVALDNIQLDLSATGMWINAFNSLANVCMKSETEIDEKIFLKAVGSGLSIKNTEDFMMRKLYDGLITSVLFKIDNLFTNILRGWETPEKKISGYYKNGEVIIKKTIIIQKQIKFHETLTILANIRNSLHNNGIHTKENLKAKIHNTEYIFEKGQAIKCASWNHVVIAVSGTIEVLSQILLSDLCEWKSYIKDDFSSLPN